MDEVTPQNDSALEKWTLEPFFLELGKMHRVHSLLSLVHWIVDEGQRGYRSNANKWREHQAP